VLKYILLLLCFPLCVAASETCPTPLILGYSGNWPPYIQTTNENDVTGADFDILKEVLAQMNCEFATRNIPISRLLKELEQGTIDIASGASRTAARERLFYYSIPYRLEVVKLLYEEANADLGQYNDVQQILAAGYLIVLNKNAWYGKELAAIKASKLKEKLVHVEKQGTRLKLFIKRRVEGFITDELISCMTLTSQQRNKYKFHPLIINQDAVYFIFSKKTLTPNFIVEFNRQLQRLKSSKKLYNIYRKHIADECFHTTSLNNLLSLNEQTYKVEK